jgi:arsenate reductase
MRKITIYHNSECSKSNEVLALLEGANVEFEVIEYLDEPPSVGTLDSLLKQLKLEPKDLVRRGEDEYTMLKLGLQPPKSRDAWLKILTQFPILIERPIVTDGVSAVIGRPPQKVMDWLNTVSVKKNQIG